MNTVDCIKTRRSVRKFTEEKVPHEVLEQLVELSRWAPSPAGRPAGKTPRSPGMLRWRMKR